MLSLWREAGMERTKAHAEWRDRLTACDASIRTEFERILGGGLPANWSAGYFYFKLSSSTTTVLQGSYKIT